MTMRRLAFLAALAALAIVASTAHAAAEKRCGDLNNAPDTAQDIRALGVSCSTAKSIARSHRRQVHSGEKCDLRKASCTISGYTCRRTFFGNSGTRVRCTNGPKRVRFFYGV
jgi:hypothetical protein